MATREQLLELLAKQERSVREAFMLFVDSVKSPEVIDAIVARLQAGDVNGAFEIVGSYIGHFANVIPQVIATVGTEAAAELDLALKDVTMAISFNATNPRAAALVSAARTRLIKELSNSQFAAVQQAIARGVANGAGAQEMGRAIRDSIGLTTNQEAYVNTYRQKLGSLDSSALGRALRDRRFDGTIADAIGRDQPLAQGQIDMMVDRYAANALALRADTISRTEALTAYGQAREEALQQMIDQTRLNQNRVTRVWYATHDERTRLWHLDMDGQRQPPGEPFIDGLGNALMFPGDPFAPPESRINCRCTVAWDIAAPDDGG